MSRLRADAEVVNFRLCSAALKAKSEVRNPRSERNPKPGSPEDPAPTIGPETLFPLRDPSAFRHSDFGLLSDFGLRISGLKFHFREPLADSTAHEFLVNGLQAAAGDETLHSIV